MDLRFPVAGASSPLGAPPTPAGLLRSLERRPGPSALHGGPLPGPAEPAAPDESEDRRSSPQIAASGFCFLAALCCSAGGFWASAAATRLLGVVFLVVGAASVLAAILFVPAGRDGKLPVHRRALPLLLALVLWAVAAWIIFLVAQSSVHGKGVLAAVAAFLLLFSLVLLRVVCRRCRHGRRPLKDAEDAVQLEDFHHVNTQVRDTLRFGQLRADPAFGPVAAESRPPVVPTAPPETPPQASASFSTFVREPPSAPAEPPPYDGFPPDGSRCRTPPPPYSTLV
ncbi:hypothetical protein HPB51_018824 [Rhipicephalus microplus]|uniref:Uncharacterized protein n=1 Tax=Rhipicephalus microplus TaxID=6941 RepID=A0A9J6DB85_RHIMP|nr:uncharacterized protein LOC119177141 [Rhipicephalus microplus]KAH8019312.1 hypothetical protein HPB51_018824 [Rhipicephalus microplus]